MKAKVWLGFGVLIVILALILRVYKLGEIPHVFDGDEAFLGYYAYSTGNWGIDEFGNKMPLYFPSIGDFKYPAYIYLSVPIVRLIGLSIFSTRILSAITGTATVGILIILIYIITQKKSESLLSGTLLAILPWHIVLSRKAVEANLGLFLVLLCVTLLTWGHKTKRKWYLVAGVLMSILAVYSYIPVRMFVFIMPILMVICGVYVKGLLPSKRITISLIIITLIAGAAFIPYDSRARSSKVALFASEDIKLKTAQSEHVDGIADSKVPLLATRAFHNKFIVGGFNIAKNFLAQLNVTNFITPAANRDRYKIPDSGLITIGMTLLALLGWANLGKGNKKLALLLGLWTICSLVPTAVTNEGADSVRMIMLIPVVTWLIVLGIVSLRERRLLWFGISVIVVFEMGIWWHNYTIHSTYENPWLLEGEYQHLASALNKHESEYKQVALHGDPYIFLLFFNKTNAVSFSNTAVFSGTKYDWDRVEAWKNIKFKVYGDCPKIGKLNILYMCKGSEVPQNAKVIELIRYADNIPAFSLIEFQPLVGYKKPDLPDGLHYMVETDLRFGKDGLLPENYNGLTL